MFGSGTVITVSASVTHPEGTIVNEQGDPVDTGTEEQK